ncbi:sensor histidine kinase [Pseudoxanthomonas wuyuanensis]|uniref:Two-component system, LytT family, sensor histidine kinase AlgZ n=1 Tax=Pseudoxanthomonas wuyuanensis TaxID=1073196 RepID=A0A286DCW5_9GAMM|nr:histidine kinase [Pseudoxanthomonas wuyuanensis]KAF1720764.1 histidine kinase [Pseudoxanthomonas wuyuanensis]SOD56473.1 two-component system, LytT family, sensor histidine kinase AlgZ [Pseudoxanthomonas wuyuanensis]
MKPTEPTSPLDALWQAPVIAWAMLAGEGVAAVLALAPGTSDNRWVAFGLISLVVQWVALGTLGGLYAGRRWLARLRPTYVAYLALAMLLLASWLICGLGWLLLGELWPTTTQEAQRMFLRISGITLTVGLMGLAAFQNHWRTRQMAVRAKQAELEALQARIRPHFLFNTLNTAAALVHQRPDATERLLLDLADLFRAALGGPAEVALADELALTRHYLEIESLRFGDRLRVNWRLPENLPPIPIPTLSIQPLVENAIRHGVEPTASGGEITIEVAITAGTVNVIVTNPLPGSGPLNGSGHHVGLSSARARVLAMTRGLGRLETAIADGHYTATITLPMPH